MALAFVVSILALSGFFQFSLISCLVNGAKSGLLGIVSGLEGLHRKVTPVLCVPLNIRLVWPHPDGPHDFGLNVFHSVLFGPSNTVGYSFNDSLRSFLKM